MNDDPPVAKYRLTVKITGNTHDEIEHEIRILGNGGYLINSDGYTRDEFKVYGGTHTATLEHVNPEMTPERYERELSEWSAARKKARRAEGTA